MLTVEIEACRKLRRHQVSKVELSRMNRGANRMIRISATYSTLLRGDYVAFFIFHILEHMPIADRLFSHFHFNQNHHYTTTTPRVIILIVTNYYYRHDVPKRSSSIDGEG